MWLRSGFESPSPADQDLFEFTLARRVGVYYTSRVDVSMLMQAWSPIHFRKTCEVKFHTVRCFAYIT